MPDSVVDDQFPELDDVYAEWKQQVAHLGGRDTMLHFRDSRDGSIDLSGAHPSGLAQLLAGRATRLSSLVRDHEVLADARRRAKSIRSKAEQLDNERGIQAAHLAIGFASWTEKDSTYKFNAPIVMRHVTLVPRGSRVEDFEIVLGDGIMINPAPWSSTCLRSTTSRYSLTKWVDATGGPHGFDPGPALDRLRDLAQSVPGLRINHRFVVSTFANIASPLTTDYLPTQHPILRALAGDEEVRGALGGPSYSPTPRQHGTRQSVAAVSDEQGSRNTQASSEHDPATADDDEFSQPTVPITDGSLPGVHADRTGTATAGETRLLRICGCGTQGRLSLASLSQSIPSRGDAKPEAPPPLTTLPRATLNLPAPHLPTPRLLAPHPADDTVAIADGTSARRRLRNEPHRIRQNTVGIHQLNCSRRLRTNRLRRRFLRANLAPPQTWARTKTRPRNLRLPQHRAKKLICDRSRASASGREDVAKTGTAKSEPTVDADTSGAEKSGTKPPVADTASGLDKDAPAGTETPDSDEDEVVSAAFKEPVTPLPDRKPQEEFLVIDVDGDQQAVVDAAVSGQSVVVDTPPGTGATQVAVAVATTLAHTGKSVLFLAQTPPMLSTTSPPASARSGSLEFAVDTRQGTGAIRKQLVGLIGSAEKAERPDLSGLLNELNEQRETLNEHVSSLHRRREPWDVSVYETMQHLGGLTSGQQLHPSDSCPVR